MNIIYRHIKEIHDEPANAKMTKNSSWPDPPNILTND